MNKQSYIFGSIGIILLVGVLLWFQTQSRDKIENPDNTQNQNQNTQVTEPPAPTFVEAVFEYHKDMPVEPKVIRAQQGQKILVRTTSDVEDEMHIHGYDLTADLIIGQSAVIEFVADKTGRFPVELEKLKKDIGIIEIYPK